MSLNEIKEKSGIDHMKEKIKKKLTLDDMDHSHTSVHTAIHTDLHQKRELPNTSSLNPNGKLQYNRKVTLYLTEDMYKAFNDIYAKRILDNNKTDKSVLICEAIELLSEKEKQKKL
jgi:hypothetical protein